MNKQDQQGDSKQQLLMTEKRRYPEVFKWKVAAIVIIVLISIFLVVNIIMIVYLNNHQPRDFNCTFAADLISLLSATTNPQITTLQFSNLMTGLTKSYQDIYFQNASQIVSWASSSSIGLNDNQVANFFTDNVEDRLTLIRFTDKTNIWIVGAFTHIPFQVPTDWNAYLTQGKQYYTFEIGDSDDRHSVIVGGSSSTYAKMNGDDSNLTNCKIIRFSSSNLIFLEAVDINLVVSNTNTAPNLILIDLPEDNYVCFGAYSSTSPFLNLLQQAIGSSIADNTQYSLIDINTFELKLVT